ncbi:hypothetical protein [Aestuariivivens insulae]|uniref:hypothetical protein n=1 Tax=Aestuariivivens insulae TaxID=1621988 RepID=UPI001F5A9C06|nr:hypothetical protein [Aestuariivivens insulae]
MKLVKQIMFFGIITLVAVSFSQCASTHKMLDSIAVVFGEVYYQTWVAGVKDAGSGINLYIPIKSKPDNIVMDSVYFKGKRAKLEQSNPKLYIARFSNTLNKPDIVMSNAPYAEYGNKVPRLKQHTPFELKDNECILSYVENNKKKYYRISGIIKKEPIFYPSAPPKKQ